MLLSKLTTDLIDLYLAIIGSDHHKQSDGYFEIRMEYCGYLTNPYRWEVAHKGYLHRGEGFADSPEGAEQILREIVCDFITDSIETYEQTIKEPETWDTMFPDDMPELIKKFNKMKEQVYA